MNIAIIIALLLLAAVMCIVYAKAKRPLASAFLGAGSGVLSLAAAKLLLSLFGIILSMNLYSIAFSLILGVPGTLLTTALHFMWH